ncbi:beta-tubulin cofactor d [Blastomyces dermatitidis ATCC 18188]|uniref:Beta-tubulin cofactor d n=1 Tax=Ajellomyces dermatitidis (strain ATCC 18188 / CBS 674.68) TaxID=653446 RepID=F2TKC9_AJEDA|nr:beta-tubulin cofactor d [Blastomyces dermatitidis ATCC 18188]
MDAPQDRDIKLQHASSDLIRETRSKLSPLLWKSRPHGNHNASSRQVHRLAQTRKALKLIDLLEPFQEWPQLLDPYLQEVLSNLVDAFLEYLTVHRDQYVLASSKASVQKRAESGGLIPLPRAICMLLYTLCKIRGVKVISRFLNNEPKYLEVMLRAFIEWDSSATTAEAAPTETAGTKAQPKTLIWEERYIMLLWLSHLLLAPFDLASISSKTLPVPYDNLSVVPDLSPDIPRVSISILSICLKYVVLPGKEREAATVLLARLALRVDMQRLGLLSSLMRWALDILRPTAESTAPPPVYTCIGVLSFISRLGVSGQVGDLAPFIVPIFNGILQISEGESPLAETIRSSASARKSMIKILRTITTLVISLDESSGRHQIPEDTVSMILENAIDYFLVSLADKDTPVRFAASKALSMITVRLDPSMTSDVIEAVLGSLDENILYEKQDGTLITPFEAQNVDVKLRKRNISAVDPQRWQGLILTLAHLLFRRSPPTSLLPSVLQSLVSGLDFEQRSSTGSSIGTSVRDASCFGIWALSRKYTTSELLDLDSQELKVTTNQEGGSTLQALAIELVCAACLDPSGNIRRGASAALQELIGRHPDTIFEGIPLVQAVDYHSVARRSRAMIEVAKGASDIGIVYWNPLVNGLLRWRGIGSPDAESRRVAARALGDLSLQESYKSLSVVLERLVEQLSTTPLQAVEARHGLFLSIAATIDAFITHRKNGSGTTYAPEYTKKLKDQITVLWGVVFDSAIAPTPEVLTDPTMRPDLTAEACARLISSLSRSCAPEEQQNNVHPTLSYPSFRLLDRAIEILLLCMCRPDDIPIEASSQAASDLFMLLPNSRKSEVVQKWFSNIHDSWRLVTGRGQIAALGAVFKRMPKSGEGRQFIIDKLIDCTGAEEKIAKRSSAVNCLATGVLPEIDDVEPISGHFKDFLNDYTTDRRGDVGSFIRLEAIEAVNIIIESKVPPGPTPMYLKDLMGCVVRLAAEKLDKVRFHAWNCLQTFWEISTDLPPLAQKYEHFSEVSSADYFLQLFSLLQVEWLRHSLSRGLVTSATTGTEVVVRSARVALLQYINNHDEQRRNIICVKLIEDWLSILESDNDDDRYAIPVVEMTAFLLDNCFLHNSPDPNMNYHKLFVLVQKFHFKSANMARIEAAIKIYSLLWRMGVIKGDAMKKLTGMLLHPYPKIRTIAADCLYMESHVEEMKGEDWSSPPEQLKAKVDNLRVVLTS